MKRTENDNIDIGFSSSEMAEFPNIVNVEVYRGTCPCRCLHCPVGIIPFESRKTFFGERGICLSLYEKIIREIENYPRSTLRIHSVGEPLDWGSLDAAIKLHSNSLTSWIFTSGVTRKEWLLELLCKKIKIIEISINSTNADDYQKTKGVDAYNLVISNLHYLRNYIDRYKTRTRLIVSRVQSTNQETDLEFLNYWNKSSLIEDAFVRSYHTYNNLLQNIEEREIFNSLHEPCLVHWARFNISVGGNAVVCFNELFKKSIDEHLVYGSVIDQPIAVIWQNRLLQSVRTAEITKDFSKCKIGKYLPCKHCVTCQPLFGRRVTSENQIQLLRGEG